MKNSNWVKKQTKKKKSFKLDYFGKSGKRAFLKIIELFI